MQPNTTHSIDQQWGYNFFKMADRIDADEYTSYFTTDGQVIIGNDPAIIGKSAGHESVLRHAYEYAPSDCPVVG